MLQHQRKFTLVLAGGGAKGSYQIGAWKALKEENIEFDSITGASVGALNAGLIAGGSYSRAEEVWDNISMDKIVSIPEEFIKEGSLDLDVKKIQAFTRFIIKNKGLDTYPLYRIIRNNLNEERIRKSGLDLGIITFNLSNLKPMELFLDRIPQGSLAKYLLASASFPLFKTVQISGKHFTDGGIYDNIPFAMAKSRGYTRFIVLDISGMGHNRRPKIEGTETIYIKNSQYIGWELDFSKEKLEQNKILGYLDTRKVFGRNFGHRYFIQPDKRREKNLEELLLREATHRKVRELFHELDIKGDTLEERIRNALPHKYRHTRTLGLSYLECAAKCLNIERIKEYSVRNFTNAILEEYSVLTHNTRSPSRRDFLRYMRGIKKRFEEIAERRDLLDLTPAEYARLGDMVFGRDERFRRLKAIRTFAPEIIPAKILELLMSDEQRKRWNISVSG